MERGWKRRPRFSYALCIDLWQPRGEGGPEHYQKKGFHLSGHVACESAHYRVEANIQPNNGASIRLVKRAGFHREGYSPRYLKIAGRWRDHGRWALLAEDWRRPR